MALKPFCGCCYRDIEADMLAAGFRVVLTRSMAGWRDLSSPSDDVLRYIEHLLVRPSDVTRRDIRVAVDDIFTQPHLRTYNKRLAILQK